MENKVKVFTKIVDYYAGSIASISLKIDNEEYSIYCASIVSDMHKLYYYTANSSWDFLSDMTTISSSSLQLLSISYRNILRLLINDYKTHNSLISAEDASEEYSEIYSDVLAERFAYTNNSSITFNSNGTPAMTIYANGTMNTNSNYVNSNATISASQINIPDEPTIELKKHQKVKIIMNDNLFPNINRGPGNNPGEFIVEIQAVEYDELDED